MNLFGRPIGRTKAGTLAPVDNRGGWLGIIRESFTGAWQQNVEINMASVLTNSIVFRCMTLISSDVAKMRVKLVKLDENGIWVESDNKDISPVLRSPNHHQNRIRFFESWMLSKLSHGNAYILKVRGSGQKVVALYVLDPAKVTPLVSTDGAVFYQLARDDLSGQRLDNLAVPASEIIHDRCNTLYHPLVGLSPIHACGLAATQGLRIQENSANFFGNGAVPAGVLSSTSAISKETAERLKAHWEANYTGQNAGRIAVLGDGLQYTAMSMNSVDAQLIEQLKWSAETICACFGVPPYMVGVGAAPSYNNIEALGQQYYSQCVQIHIEGIELCLDDGLELKDGLGTEFDLDDLLRMDTSTLVKAEGDAVKAGIKTPNEARKRLNLGPVTGGNTPYLQQQNFSLAALDKRDQREDPFSTQSAKQATDTPDGGDDTEKLIAALFNKSTEIFQHA